MNTEAIITLIFSSIATVISIISLITGYIFQFNQNVVEKRIIPSISYLDSSLKSFIERLKTCDDARIINSNRRLKELGQKKYRFIWVKNLEETKISECKLSVYYFDCYRNEYNQEVDKNYYFGTLTIQRDLILPCIFDSNLKTLIVELIYRTEGNEIIELKHELNIENGIINSKKEIIKKYKISKHKLKKEWDLEKIKKRKPKVISYTNHDLPCKTLSGKTLIDNYENGMYS